MCSCLAHNALKSCGPDVTSLCLAEFTHHNGIALQQLVTDHGIEIRRMPDDVLAALARETKIVLEEAAASDDMTKRVFESYRAELLRVAKWSEISDEAYMTARRTLFSL